MIKVLSFLSSIKSWSSEWITVVKKASKHIIIIAYYCIYKTNSCANPKTQQLKMIFLQFVKEFALQRQSFWINCSPFSNWRLNRVRLVYSPLFSLGLWSLELSRSEKRHLWDSSDLAQDVPLRNTVSKESGSRNGTTVNCLSPRLNIKQLAHRRILAQTRFLYVVLDVEWRWCSVAFIVGISVLCVWPCPSVALGWSVRKNSDSSWKIRHFFWPGNSCWDCRIPLLDSRL